MIEENKEKESKQETTEAQADEEVTPEAKDEPEPEAVEGTEAKDDYERDAGAIFSQSRRFLVP